MAPKLSFIINWLVLFRRSFQEIVTYWWVGEAAKCGKAEISPELLVTGSKNCSWVTELFSEPLCLSHVTECV